MLHYIANHHKDYVQVHYIKLSLNCMIIIMQNLPQAFSLVFVLEYCRPCLYYTKPLCKRFC